MKDLKTLQEELDVKKWYESVKQRQDTCGTYSYCAYCEIMEENPCARAYLAEEEILKKNAPKAEKKNPRAVAEEPKAKKAPAKKPAAKKAPAKKAAEEVAAADAKETPAKPKKAPAKKAAAK